MNKPMNFDIRALVSLLMKKEIISLHEIIREQELWDCLKEQKKSENVGTEHLTIEAKWETKISRKRDCHKQKEQDGQE